MARAILVALMTSRHQGKAIIVRAIAVACSWLVGAVVVRIGLAWADTYPYSRASEVRYGIVATLALSIAIAGTSAAVSWRRPR